MPQEKIIVITDPGKLPEAIVFFESAKRYGSAIDLLVFEGMRENAEEPPEEITREMESHDVALLVTTYSLSHTRARERANKKGTRIASMPGITKEMMMRTFSSDYKKIEQDSLYFSDILTRGTTVHLTSPGGTSLTFSIDGRTALADTGNLSTKGARGNLPAGEAFVAPREGTAEGTIVFDGALAGTDLDRPITLTITNGKIQTIRGEKAAATFEKRITQVGEKARVMGEFGIGTNPNTRVCPNVLEAEKVKGTVHIAFGDNVGFGGVNEAPFHSDGVILKPTVVIDGKTIMKEGEWE